MGIAVQEERRRAGRWSGLRLSPAASGNLQIVGLLPRVMRAVNAPAGIGHLEDPEVLDLVATAQEVGTSGYQPGVVVLALRNLAPYWIQCITYTLILAQFRWWIALGLCAIT